MSLKNNLKLTVLIISCILLLTGCSNSKETEEIISDDKDVLISLILDNGGIQDNSFNQSAWNGAIKASEELEVEVKYLESNTDADYAQNIKTAIDMDSDLIIGVGINLSEAIKDSAINNPEQKFAIIDGSFESIPSNVTPITFNEKESGYLAGIAAAKTIDSNKFGFIGGFEIPTVVNYRDGFEKGIKEVNPNAILLTQYTNSFTDMAKGIATAEQLISVENVSCIVSAAGDINVGIQEVCSEKGKYVVGVDIAQNHINPDTILTSAIKRIDVGIYETIKRYIDGNLQFGYNLNYNISNNGVDYEKTNLLTQETIDYVDSIKTSNFNI